MSKKFLAELDELRDSISRSRTTFKLIEEKIDSISKIATPTSTEEDGDINE